VDNRQWPSIADELQQLSGGFICATQLSSSIPALAVRRESVAADGNHHRPPGDPSHSLTQAVTGLNSHRPSVAAVVEADNPSDHLFTKRHLGIPT
jgi:hypothetical protein